MAIRLRELSQRSAENGQDQHRARGGAGAGDLQREQHRLHRHGLCRGRHPAQMARAPGHPLHGRGHPAAHAPHGERGHHARAGHDPPGHQPRQHHGAAQRHPLPFGLRRRQGSHRPKRHVLRAGGQDRLQPPGAVHAAGRHRHLDGRLRPHRHPLLLRHRRHSAQGRGSPRPGRAGSHPAAHDACAAPARHAARPGRAAQGAHSDRAGAPQSPPGGARAQAHRAQVAFAGDPGRRGAGGAAAGDLGALSRREQAGSHHPGRR